MLTEKKSLVSIDLLRALAALSVFGYHQHVGQLLAQYSGISWLQSIDILGASYAVPLFFLISGYCIHLANIKHVNSLSPLPLIEYYKRRIFRIYPAYLSALLISLTIQFSVNNISYSLADIFTHLFLLQGFNDMYFNSIGVVLWTISIEFLFYLLYPVFYHFRLKYSLKKALMLSGCISLVSIIYFSSHNNISLSERYFVLNIWFSWCCGAYLADVNTLNSFRLKAPVYKLTYAFVLALYILVQFVYKPWMVIIDYQLKILIWTMPLILIINAEQRLLKINNTLLKIFTAIGLSSYSLYLLHEPLIILKNHITHALLPHKLQIMGVASGIVLIPLVCWLHYLYVERPFIVRRRPVLNE